jgi:hypothetical protein
MSRSRHNVLFRDQTWAELEAAAREGDTTVTEILDRAALLWLWLKRQIKPNTRVLVEDEDREREIVIL